MPSIRKPLKKNTEKCKQLKPLFMALVNKSTNALICQGSVDLLMGQLVDELKLEDRDSNYNQNFIEEVLAYISENYKENITFLSPDKSIFRLTALPSLML